MEFDPTFLIGALFLFTVVAIGMLIAPLIVGYFLRPHNPTGEKETVYECGEPTIGSSFAQFDLRFYVVALLFIVFDVEIAFFFPWAVVFGKANTLAVQSPQFTKEKRVEVSEALLSRKLTTDQAVDPEVAKDFLKIALADLLVFFGVVLVGFAYIWRRGDLDWVRAYALERAQAGAPPGTVAATREAVGT